MDSLRTSVLKKGEQRNDKWGKEVYEPITCTQHFVATDAFYHRCCYFKFMGKGRLVIHTKRG